MRVVSSGLGAGAFVVLAGACQIYVAGEPPPQGGAPHRVAQAAPAPPAPAPAPPPPAPVRAPAPRPPAPQRTIALRFPARIVHPAPLANAATGQLNVQGLKLKLRIGRKCGPREVPPGSGHFIHLDCNLHAAVTQAKPFSVRKIRMMLAGNLKLDTPVGTSALADRATFAGIPDAVDHRKDGTEGPIEDQGQVGSCTAFSLASAMDNGIRRQNKSDTMSPMHIWSHYGYPVIKNAGDENLNKPIVAWDGWPYDERTACELDQSGDGDCGPYLPPVVPGAGKNDPLVAARERDSDARGHWRVTEYDEIPADPDTIAAILVTGADVWFTMNIGNSWLNASGDTVADWNDSQIEGGHALVFAGFRHKNGQRQFLVHNSWGKDWGDQGFGYVSEAMVKQFTKHAYKVVVADASAPTPPVNDPTALTDDDCGEDQVVDSVTGQCVTICPDDTRPANGACDAAGAKRPAARPVR